MPRKTSQAISARILGDATIATGVTTIEPNAEILFAAALYFVLERKKPVNRRELQALLWPKESSSVGAHRLRQTLLKLKHIGFPIEASGREHLTLNGTPVSLDIEEFLSTRSGLDNENADALVMLPSYEPRFSEAYLEWLDTQKAHVNASLTRIMLAVIAQHRVKGEWVDVERNATKLLRFQPFNEEATLALAEAHAMRGEKLQATAILDKYLAEVGNGPTDLKLPATIMRRRIADRLHPRIESNIGQSPLVGRSAEMELLGQLFSETRSGKGQTCVVWGDAGVGKSRLLAEFSTFAALQGVPTQRVHCRPSDQHQPLSVFVDLVPALRSMRGALGCSPETLTYLDTLTRPAAASENPATKGSDPEFIYSRIEAAVFDLVDAVSDEGCLIILIEDMHWMDGASTTLLREMISWNKDHPILFAFTGRDSPQTWLNGLTPNVSIVRLEPLEVEPSRDIILGVARQSGREVGAKYLDWCVNVAEGNPYFLQELANQWIEKGDERIAPRSLTAVLDDRVSRLSEDALLVLQTCALLEGQSTVDHIAETIDFPSHRLIRAINELASVGMLLIELDQPGDANRLASRHDLLSNAVLTRLTEPARVLLHRRIGTVLEKEIALRPSAALMWESANHWRLAGDKTHALALARSCGSHLLNVGLPASAVEAYERALLYCVSVEDRLITLGDLATACDISTDFTGVRAAVRKAKSLQRKSLPTDSQHDELELMDLRAEWQLALPLPIDHALNCLHTETANPNHRIEAGTMAIMMLDTKCERERMREPYGLIEQIGREHGIYSAPLLEARMVYNVVAGSLPVAVDSARALLELERKNANCGTLCRRLHNAALIFRAAGLHEEAIAVMVECERLADQHKMPSHALGVLPMLGHVALERGDVEGAKRYYEKAMRLRTDQNPLAYRDVTCIGARLALLDNNPGLARRRWGKQFKDLGTTPNWQGRCYESAVYVAIKIVRGPISEKELFALKEPYAKAKTSLRQAYSCLVLVTALKIIGQRNEAERELHEYRTRLRREPWPIPEGLFREVALLEKFATNHDICQPIADEGDFS